MSAIVMLMETAYALFIGLSLLGLIAWLPVIWPARKGIMPLLVLYELCIAAAFVYLAPGVGSIIFTSAALYKVFNISRIIRNRMQIDHLRSVSLRSALVLSSFQSLIAVVVSVSFQTGNWPHNAVYGMAIGQLLVSVIIFGSTQRHLKTTKTLQATTAYTDSQLPSLSVLIPARNETDDLDACLQALTASNYPKLEVIVLDDCSQNKHTPEIIRSFAQQGVRFIAGDVPGDNWLAKNFAYQQLADAASGELLLFCGVDLRVTPDALRELVTTMLEKNKTMMSVLPHNDKPQDVRTLLIQPVRYAWEISLPRRLFNRPAVLSTCWLIKRSALVSAGSFKATSRSIVPESHFAKSAARNDGYSFLRSNMVVSSKPASEQQATTIRMRYPQLHRRPELVWLLTLTELIGLVLPIVLIVVSTVAGLWVVFGASLIAYVLLSIVFLEVSGVMYGRPMAAGIIVVPIAALFDVILLHISMYRYEFKDVQWKDRNICLPIMRFDSSVERSESQS